MLAERGVAPVAFDAISEFEYTDAAAFEAMCAMLEGVQGDRLREDERNFMHKPGNSFFAAERRRFGGTDRPAPGEHSKVMALLRDDPPAEPMRLAARAIESATALAAYEDVVHVEIDVPRRGDPLGAPAWQAVLHVWLAHGGGSDHALDRLEATVAGTATWCCLQVEERGEPCPLEAEGALP